MAKKVRVLVTVLLLILLVSSVASAESQLPSWAQEKKVADKKFMIVSVLLVGSTIYDVETTYFSIGKGARELNPITKSLVYKGRPVLYAIQGLVDFGVIYASYEIKKSNTEFRKYWYILPVSVTVAHLIAGSINIRVALSF